jgi:hypothetical protein
MARAALAALLVCVLALAGCTALADLGQLREDLDAAGYNATSVNHNTTNGNAVLSIGISMPDAVPTDDDANKVAEIVWTKFKGDFDRLVIDMNGAVRVDATPDDLTSQFGERPESLTEPSGKKDGGGSSALTVILILAGAVVFAGLMVLVWYRGRGKPPAPPQPNYQPGGHFQYPPQPPQG